MEKREKKKAKTKTRRRWKNNDKIENPVNSWYVEMTETDTYYNAKPKDHLRIKYR